MKIGIKKIKTIITNGHRYIQLRKFSINLIKRIKV